MRFNARRVIRGANMVRHSVKAIVGNAVSRVSGMFGGGGSGAAPKPTGKGVNPFKQSSPKTSQKAKQQRFKTRLKRQTTANPPTGANGKKINKQQRAQGALTAMQRWKQKRGKGTP